MADETDSLLEGAPYNNQPSYGCMSVNTNCAHSKDVDSKTLNTSSSQRLGNWVNHLLHRLPFVNGISNYGTELFLGDLTAAATVSALYVPLCISYALLAKTHAISGLHSFIISTILYGLFGQSPQMITGPEGPGSLLVGTAVLLASQANPSQNLLFDAETAGAITAFTGTIMMFAGLTRLGYLDAILSRPFMRGLISGMGVSLMIEQSIPELGLVARRRQDSSAAGSSVARKVVFVVSNIKNAHRLTALVSLSSLVIVMFFRTAKRRWSKRYTSFTYFPDRILLIIITAVLTWLFQWQEQGLEILGRVDNADLPALPFHWPFHLYESGRFLTILEASFTIALVGLFESLLTLKALGKIAAPSDKNSSRLNTNQEMIALGSVNLIAGCFLGLPAFGGYGRSRLNVATGAKTPMSSIFIGLISLVCVLFLLPTLYYVPKSVLAALVSEVGFSMVEEVPHDLRYFWAAHGWSEISLMTVVFLTTMLHSISAGMMVGLLLSLLLVIKHATKAHLNIGRAPFGSAEFQLFSLAARFPTRFCIVRVAHKITFANVEDLKKQLWKISSESFEQPTSEPEFSAPIRALVLSFVGHASLDTCACQELLEVVDGFVRQRIKFVFCCPRGQENHQRIVQKLQRSAVVELDPTTVHIVESYEEVLEILDVLNSDGGGAMQTTDVFEV